MVLGSQPTGPVRIRVARAPDLSVEPEELVFSPSDWARPQRVRVTAAHDEDAVADEPVRLVHAASGGDYEGAEASSQVTIVEDDVATLAVAGSRTTERAGRLTFDVTLSRASTAEVTVDYATGMVGDTAAAPVDYIVERGKLRFAAGSTSAQAIEVVVRDDALDEPDEQLTVTLSNARNAPLAGGADTVAATGTIEDDDELPVLTISPAVRNRGRWGAEFPGDAAAGERAGGDRAVRHGGRDGDGRNGLHASEWNIDVRAWSGPDAEHNGAGQGRRAGRGGRGGVHGDAERGGECGTDRRRAHGAWNDHGRR